MLQSHRVVRSLTVAALTLRSLTVAALALRSLAIVALIGPGFRRLVYSFLPIHFAGTQRVVRASRPSLGGG